jgi:T4 bacteriophage base plate protein
MLPKIDSPLFKMALPVSKLNITYRPMVQKDEKILLIAKEGNDPTEILGAIKQVVQNCLLGWEVGKNSQSLEPKFTPINVDDLPIVDLEWAFIQLRATSVSNISKVSYIDGVDQEQRDFDIDLNKVKVIVPDAVDPKTPSPKILLNDGSEVKLRYPPAWLYSNKEFLHSNGADATTKLAASCIEQIKASDGVVNKDFTPAEAEEFILSWSIPIYEKLTDWISNLPHLNYELKYKNNEDQDRVIVLSSLNDFFTFA